MTTAMENLKDMIEVNTIIGDPDESPDGSVIIPVSKHGFGFEAGGSEFNSNQSQDDSGEATLSFGGGIGGGVSMTPVAFLFVNRSGRNMNHLDKITHTYQKIIEYAPKASEKIQDIKRESNKDNNKRESKKHTPTNYDI